MSNFIALLMAGIFTDNIVTSKLLGIEDASENSGSALSLIKKCGVLTALLVLSTAVSYPVTEYILVLLGLGYLSSLAAVIIICGLLAAADIISKKYLPTVYEFLEKNRRVLVCSSVVLGMCLSAAQNELVTGYLSALVFAAATGIGFALVSFVFYGIRHRLDASDLPEAVKGLPVTLVIASLISMAFSGLA